MDEQERKDREQEIVEQINQLPDKMRAAFLWLIVNFDAAEEMCRGKGLTQEQRENLWRRAEEKEDYHMMVLLLLEKVLNDDGPSGAESAGNQ